MSRKEGTTSLTDSISVNIPNSVNISCPNERDKNDNISRFTSQMSEMTFTAYDNKEVLENDDDLSYVSSSQMPSPHSESLSTEGCLSYGLEDDIITPSSSKEFSDKVQGRRSKLQPMTHMNESSIYAWMTKTPGTVKKTRRRDAPQDKIVSSSVSSQNPSATTNPIHREPVLSPPFHLFSPGTPKTRGQPPSHIKTPVSKNETTTRTPLTSPRIRSKLLEEMTALEQKFKDLNEQAQKSSSDKDKAFYQDLSVLEQKANLMVDALLNLEKDNRALRKELNNRSEDSGVDLHSQQSDVENDQNDGQQKQHENLKGDKYTTQNVTPSRTSILKDLQSTDNYIKRTYPAVPKTPGTMFTTELCEHMELEVGDHAYLADLMDRQWATSHMYYPSRS